MILKILKYHWRAIIWLVIIAVGCLMPEKDIPGSGFFATLFAKIPYFDKLVHFLLYFIFTLFLMSGFSRQYSRTLGKAYIYSFLIAFCLGVSIELIQDKIGRTFDLFDLAGNTFGIIVSLLLFNPVRWILRNIL
ncbi:MAG: VanZ family protein [Prevotellaceae bacterium]|jgi:hypothetical protein|nr:VanZ family protein [Prevotellaceae bacterium]